MSVLSIRLPDSLHDMVKRVAAEDHISLNQFIASAVAEKISALTTEKYLDARAARATKQRFVEVMSKAPPVDPETFDQWD